MRLLNDRTVIVTGASTGIGRAAAILFAEHGANVVLAARRSHLLDEVVAAIEAQSGQAASLAGDVGDQDFARALVELAVGRYGGLDGAFNNAGTMGTASPIGGLSSTSWDEVIRVNLTGAYNSAASQVPALVERGRGSIVFTSSFVGHTVGFPGFSAYAASKAGVLGLTTALAAELGPTGVRVNALLPGGTDTPMSESFAETPDDLVAVAQMHALKRIADPREIASAALYLLSDLSSFSTGGLHRVDGGVSISRT